MGCQKKTFLQLSFFYKETKLLKLVDIGVSIHLETSGLFTGDIYNGTIMIYDTKTISCTIRATYYVLENKTQLS